MKKSLLIFALFMFLLFSANAGYIIRGIYYASSPPEDLKNYTLAFKDGEPIAAASMNSTLAPGTRKNTIVIIDPYSSTARAFPIPDYNIEVRDFHHIRSNDTYLLCGSAEVGSITRAFIAVINSNFTVMRFFEYPEADMFYSILNVYPNTPTPAFSDYYVCGKSGSLGIIASVDRISFMFTNYYYTSIPWEYHKIIAKYDPGAFFPHIIASGRNPERTKIGFTKLDPSFNPAGFMSYFWEQNTTLRSHCVVSDDPIVNNTIILASSNGNIVTLNPVTYPILPTQVSAYRFALPGLLHSYHIYDIGTLKINANNFRISLAGFASGPTANQVKAWHGSLVGLSTASTMRNNYYIGPPNGPYGRYEHYKIRYQDVGALYYKEYTGGYFQSTNEMCALFGTPLTLADCDSIYISGYPTPDHISWGMFLIQQDIPDPRIYHSYPSQFEEMPAFFLCPTFKGGEAPEYSILPPKDETEITNFYDKITVKDTPSGTNYQIYSVTGQLIQTGTTNPDISTAQLAKGMYILRLETGKAFKFVK